METRLQSLGEATRKLREGNDKLETPAERKRRQRREQLETAKRFVDLLQSPTARTYVITSSDIHGIAKVLSLLIDEALETTSASSPIAPSRSQTGKE